MKAFQKVLEREYENDTRLGMPSTSEAHRLRRLAAMERMTGGRGFRKPAKEPRTDSQGRTRGDRKRAARAAANAKVSDVREPQFMHSAARRRAFPDLYPAPRPMTGFFTPEQRAAFTRAA